MAEFEKKVVSRNTFGNTYEAYSVKEDVIWVARSELVQGRNKHSGKSFARFQTVNENYYSFRGPRLRVYSRKKAKRQQGFPGGLRDVTAREIDFPSLRDMTDEAFKTRFDRDFKDVVRDQYPMIEYLRPVPGLTAHLVAHDAADLTRRLYGASNYRKDLVRAVGGVLAGSERASRDIFAPNWKVSAARETASDILSFSSSVRGLVPADWIVGWLGTLPTTYTYETSECLTRLRPDELRKMFRTADQKQLRRLLRSGPEKRDMYWLKDTTGQFMGLLRYKPDYRLSDIQFSSLKDLHDVISRDYRRSQHASKPVEYKGKGGKLAGDYGDVRIVAPEETGALGDWGNEMENCIAGYGNEAVEGRTLLYGIYQGGNLVGNMELDPKTGDVRQLLGRFNRSLPSGLSEQVYQAVRSVWPNANVIGGWQ